ncbi:hypothetical protein Mmc1_0379 [Magnetococcus marinus MC-1]|uniref:STAS domain-containing protein n=1 Tax=Magnetococcus marinus (strain ATCC BAA-1437 / JCM 17883 / MC-1) TaxID=156889 RepID=A0L4L2_MAGMM|nr:hypothetical protein [Magnetococcus marinus]ABK42905.1 hypothetical protein Mmc1_0379 [Magnetococcus marinus MC-1]
MAEVREGSVWVLCACEYLHGDRYAQFERLREDLHNSRQVELVVFNVGMMKTLNSEQLGKLIQISNQDKYEVCLTNVSEQNYALMKLIGLERFVKIYDKPQAEALAKEHRILSAFDCLYGDG